MRYDLQLPEFTRIIWASNEAREVWESRICSVASAWTQIERVAVVEGIKPAALQVCSPEDLPNLTTWCLERALMCIPLSRQGAARQGYVNATQPVQDGGKWDYRVVIARESLAKLFVEFWRDGDDLKIGAALGFPRCCQEFFERYWVKDGWRDLTFAMVMGEIDARAIRVGGAMECNILLRWLGVRLVSHLPCSFYCDATEALGQKLGLLGLKYGYVSEMDWLTQMLSWPVRWTSLHGVATITTPVLRIITDTTAVEQKLTIDRDGPSYPLEGARGTEFPFKQLHTLTVRRANDYADNGFVSREAMDHAHSVILRAASKALMETGLDSKVIDLGCGNGKLLESILGTFPVIPCGVEKELDRFQRASRRLLEHDPAVHHCDIFDEHFWDPPYRLALISVSRLTEVEPDDARKLLVRLRDSCHKVIFYSYSNSRWEGAPGVGITEFFKLEEQFSGDSTCAFLTIPKRENDYDSVQN